MRDPDQRVAVDDGETSKLAAVACKTIQERLADVRDAGGHVKALAENCKAHGESVETGSRILFGPTEINQGRQEAMRTALRQHEAVGDFSEGHLASAVSEQLNDPKATFCGYVSHFGVGNSL